MAQIDSNATLEQIEQMEREFARKRMLAEMKRAAELARLSESQTTVDECGITWGYIVVNKESVRITSCVTAQERLFVPETIAGLPVKELGAEALAGLSSPREIVCADSIESIGAYAFRLCENLRRLVLPANTVSFSGGWIAKCPSLTELVLPDAVNVLSAEMLSNPAIRTMAIGKEALFVDPGAFGKSQLETVTVDACNEHLKTDGTCLYTRDGRTKCLSDAGVSPRRRLLVLKA